jgi:TPR repeat protein
VHQNLAAAAHWFEKAANRGDRDAQFILGELYWEGKGVPRDHDQAVKWFRLAAAQGDLQAHRVLAILGAASDDEEQDPQVSTGIHKQNRVIPIGRHPQHNPCKNDFAFAPDLFSIDPLVHANTYRDQMRPTALQPFEPD